MSIVTTINGVDVSDLIEFGGISELTTSARGGSRGGGKLVITDPTGTLDLHGWHTLTIDETDCVSRPRMFTGRIGGKEISRGAEGPIGVGRVWDCELEDVNALAHMRTFEVDSAKRPAETNHERIAYVLSTAAVGGSFADTGYVTAIDPVDFDEADYRQSYPDTPFDDVSGPIGFDWFLFWDYVALEVSLFYDLRDNAVLNSSLAISNVAGDPDDPTDPDAAVFAPSSSGRDVEDVHIKRDHDQVYDRVTIVYANGTITLTRPATTAEFFADAPGGRGMVIENTRIGRLATATSHGNQFLEAHSLEYDTITIPVHLPATHVNLVATGERIAVRLEHEPGYSSYVYVRVAQKTLSTAGLGEDNLQWYDVVLECTNQPPTGIGGGGAPPPDDFPHPPSGEPTLVQTSLRTDGGTFTPVIGTPTEGDLIFMWITARSVTYPGTPSGWTSVATAKNTSIFADNYYARLVRKTASGDTHASIQADIESLGTGHQATFMDWLRGTFGAEVHQSDTGETGSTGVASATPLACGGAITPSAANAVVVGCGIVGTFGATTVAPSAGVTEIADFQFPPGDTAPANWVGYKSVATPVSTTIGGIITGRSEFGGVTFTVLPSAGSNPPTPGKDVPPEIVVLDGPRGRVAAGAFADGSLRVWVDILEQTAGLLYVDGECGDFTLGFTPQTGEVVTVTYKGR